MRPGEMRHRVTLQKPALSRSSTGQPSKNWETVTLLWAKIEDLSGREYFIAQQAPTAQVTTRVTIRWRVGVKPEMRILYEDRIFDIKAVLEPEGRRRWLQIMCQEVF